MNKASLFRVCAELISNNDAMAMRIGSGKALSRLNIE